MLATCQTAVCVNITMCFSLDKSFQNKKLIKYTQSYNIIETVYEDGVSLFIPQLLVITSLVISTKKSIVYTLISVENSNYKEILNYA